MDSFDKYDEPRLHMERLLRCSIVSLDIPTRILYKLADAEIRTIGQLVSHSTASLMKINRIGVAAIAEIKKQIAYAGLTLADEPA